MNQEPAIDSATDENERRQTILVGKQAVAERVYAGHNRISTQALISVAKAVTAEVLLAPSAQVRVSWSDDAGALALSVSSAMGAPSLREVRWNPDCIGMAGGSVLSRATAAKARILGRVEDITGSQLSRVDVRISGLLVRDGGRVL